SEQESLPASPAWFGSAYRSSPQGWPPESQSAPASPSSLQWWPLESQSAPVSPSSLQWWPPESQSALAFPPRSSEQE
ncbi:hypothetical protein PF001_g31160, partial [Phytophthora fragariae]